ncbi:hypothetical protein DICVIV_13229 [Dictyocaulus viviparus]|uniref:Uncharacterized protein n=1 Tax=Dictyocaulus viviparus TaxID=29172 RepID=A0A0D8X8E1_DICVI|nr:hypothetical protein DICVIV_13229 [Dictyocaulus viviparus]
MPEKIRVTINLKTVTLTKTNDMNTTGYTGRYVPKWAVWLFAACFLLIVVVLLLDYCVTRRNALGNTCCIRSRQKRNIATAVHQKRSTNMLLNKLNRQGQCADQDV